MKRFLKIVAILALFTVAIAYVGFRVFFFDPFGSRRPTLDSLVPKDVDVMVRRKELEADFEPFPMPRFFKTLKLKSEWEALTRTRVYRDAPARLAVERTFAELEKVSAQIQPLDLMPDLAGREVMLLGKWRPDGALSWAVIARGSFRSKLFAEAIKLAVVRKTQGELIRDYAEKEGVRSFTLAPPGGEAQRLHLARIQDALVCGNDFDLVHQVVALDAGTTGGLDQSPQYRAAILQPSTVGRPIDFVVDVADACKNLKLAWPPPNVNDPVVLRFVRDLLVPEHFGQAIGRLALGNQIELSASVPAELPALQAASGGLFDGASVDLGGLHKFCGRVFPAKVALCGYVRLDVKQFLRRVESLLDPAERQVLNDFVANLKARDQRLTAKSTVELLDQVADFVTNEFAFALEPDEPYQLPDVEDWQFPDPQWGPRIALIFPVSDKSRASDFVSQLVNVLNARQDVISNVFKWTYKEIGIEFREVKLIDASYPTVSIGLLELEKRDCLVVTTTGQFLHEIVQQKGRAEKGANSGLQSELFYRQSQEAVAGVGQAFVWSSSPNLRKVLSDLCQVWGEQVTRPDWTAIRKEIEQRVVAKSHPELRGKPLDQEALKKIEPEVDREIEAREQKWKEETLPQKVEELRADLELMQMVRWFAATLKVDDRDLGLRLRVATPANFSTEALGAGGG